MSALIAGAAVGSALIGAYASNSAANTQAGAINAANQTAQNQYNTTREDQAPYRAAGTAALSSMQNPSFQHTFGAADFQADPGYQFRRDQGNKAIQASAAAKGGLNSASTMQALSNYNQGEAAQGYQQAFNNYQTSQTNNYNRLASLAGVSQAATNATDAAGANAAQTIGQNQVGQGQALASGQMGVANAVSGAAGQGLNSWMSNTLMNRLLPPGGPNGATPITDSGYAMPSTSIPAASGGYANALGDYSY